MPYVRLFPPTRGAEDLWSVFSFAEDVMKKNTYILMKVNITFSVTQLTFMLTFSVMYRVYLYFQICLFRTIYFS